MHGIRETINNVRHTLILLNNDRLEVAHTNGYLGHVCVTLRVMWILKVTNFIRVFIKF